MTTFLIQYEYIAPITTTPLIFNEITTDASGRSTTSCAASPTILFACATSAMRMVLRPILRVHADPADESGQPCAGRPGMQSQSPIDRPVIL
jgi:hypothetical protein